jgi:hypothetical protein
MTAAEDVGGRTYRLHAPADVPVTEFWSVTVYQNLTPSMLNPTP